jgi:ATP-dependent DNA ligase
MTEPSSPAIPPGSEPPERQPRIGARAVLADLRPQPFGSGRPGRVADPLIEPLWAGVRALAAIEDGSVDLADEHGQAIDDQAAVATALAEAALARELILDGVLTKLATRDGGVYVPMDDLPSASAMVARPLLGIRPTRAEQVTRALEAAREARTFGPDDVVTFVAIDLLWVDGESLVDVPLLERRRLLESVVAESDLVRRGIFVRPPLDAWIGSWRALGFDGLTFRSANSRYQPGRATDDWVSAPMPRR